MTQVRDSRLYLFAGSDPAGVAAAAKRLMRELVGDKPDPFVCDTIVESDNLSTLEALQQTVSSVRSPPFFGDCKTVWLKDFSGFSGETKTGQLAEPFARLCDFIEAGIPADIRLVLSGCGIDRRKRLYKLCKAGGVVEEFEKPMIADRDWEGRMGQIIERRARDKGVRIAPDAVDYLVQVLGTDTTRIEPELEKLIAYCGGPGETLTMAAAQEVCRGDGEFVAWAVRDAVGNRDLRKVLSLTESILHGERDPDRAILGMIRQTADGFYAMIQVLMLMHRCRVRQPRQLGNLLKTMAAEDKQRALEDGLEIVGWHPYRVQMLAQQATRFSGPELVEAVKCLRDGFWSCISAPSESRIVWDSLVFRILGREDARRQ